MTSDRSHEAARPSPESGRQRLPPGQLLTAAWPVLHEGAIPEIDLDTWRLRIFGLAERKLTLDWEQFMALPQVRTRSDIHCVTTWSRYDNDWEGVRFRDLAALAGPVPEAAHVMFHCYGGYTTNVPLAELMGDDVLLAHSHEGSPLTPEHGWPLRPVIPSLYFWKSAKWVNGIEFLDRDSAGFWERYGYHMHGDPWLEERYA